MANTSGSKIEASNQDFNTLMQAIYQFLNTPASQVGTGQSGIDKYSFSSNNNVPHTITSTQSATANSTITNGYTAALNIIYDIWKNNYMHNNNITIVNAHQEYKDTGSIIPALDNYQQLVNYWNTGSNACNGACTGYCEGNCANTNQTEAHTSEGEHCVNCNSICYVACGSNCYFTCSVTCGNGCEYTCEVQCGGYCADTCGNSCVEACASCSNDCSNTCNGCYSTCTGGCGNGCQNNCGGRCVGGCTGNVMDNAVAE